MKRLILGVALAVLAGSAFAADVGVSINIGQPGFYGRIDLGNVAQPQVIYAQPVVIQPVQVGVVVQPLYLRVPFGHEKQWARHCREYNACGQPVYFVRDDWYSNVYAPQYRGEHRRIRDDDDDNDDDHGNRGHGKGHGKGNRGGHDD